MSSTPEFDAIQAAHAAANGGGAHAAPQPPATIGRHAWVPKWFRVILHATHAGVSHMAPVIMSPEVDQLIEAALRAEGMGVEAQWFQAAIDVIEGAASRKQQAPALPAPAADGSEAM